MARFTEHFEGHFKEKQERQQHVQYLTMRSATQVGLYHLELIQNTGFKQFSLHQFFACFAFLKFRGE